MRSPARFRIAASFLAISVAAACGSDSTGPGQLSAAQLAAHFDSIAIVANAQSDTNSAYGTRSEVATLIEIPAALGASPSTVSVTTASGVEQWKAYELLEVSPASTDSLYILLAFRDADAHTAIVVFFDSAGTAQGGGVITGDTITVNPSNGSGATSLTSISTTCATPAASLANPLIGTFSVSACNLAKFRTTVSLTSSTTPGLDAALTSVSFSNMTVNGIRAVDQAQGASVRRLKALFRAAAAQRHS
jgi:hypothetical protein